MFFGGNQSRGFALSRPLLFRQRNGRGDTRIPCFTSVGACKLRGSEQACDVGLVVCKGQVRKQRPRGLNGLTRGHSVSGGARVQTQVCFEEQSVLGSGFWSWLRPPRRLCDLRQGLFPSLGLCPPLYTSGLLLMTSAGPSSSDSLTGECSARLSIKNSFSQASGFLEPHRETSGPSPFPRLP